MDKLVAGWQDCSATATSANLVGHGGDVVDAKKDLSALRQGTPEVDRAILDGIWNYAVSRNLNEWPTVRETNIRFSIAGAADVLSRFPADAIFIAEEKSATRYRLSFLGLLLSSAGPQCENLLTRYLDYLRQRARADFEVRFIKSDEVKRALNLTEEGVMLLGQGIFLGQFHGDRPAGGGPVWACDVPHDLDALMLVPDLLRYVRDRALKGVGGPSLAQTASASGRGPLPSSHTGGPVADVLLEPEQAHTLEILVEASRSTPSDQRQPFRAVQLGTGAGDLVLLRHPGVSHDQTVMNWGDLEHLAAAGLIRLEGKATSCKFDVTSRGHRHYEELKVKQGESVTRVEEVVRTYLNAPQFGARHAAAFAKWEEAERMLWDSDSQDKATTIGHLCREAHQEFATSLLVHHPNTKAPPDVQKSKDRLRAALTTAAIPSERVAQLAESLGAYWSAVIDLAQRQEHGLQNPSDPLTWEDSRRLVFMTLVAMTELDRTTQKRA